MLEHSFHEGNICYGSEKVVSAKISTCTSEEGEVGGIVLETPTGLRGFSAGRGWDYILNYRRRSWRRDGNRFTAAETAEGTVSTLRSGLSGRCRGRAESKGGLVGKEMNQTGSMTCLLHALSFRRGIYRLAGYGPRERGTTGGWAPSTSTSEEGTVGAGGCRSARRRTIATV